MVVVILVVITIARRGGVDDRAGNINCRANHRARSANSGADHRARRANDRANQARGKQRRRQQHYQKRSEHKLGSPLERGNRARALSAWQVCVAASSAPAQVVQIERVIAARFILVAVAPQWAGIVRILSKAAVGPEKPIRAHKHARVRQHI